MHGDVGVDLTAIWAFVHVSALLLVLQFSIYSPPAGVGVALE